MRTFFEKYAFYFCLKIICLEVLAISKQELQINEEIRDREILVIDQNGTKLGTMSARDAQKLAYEQDLDLVKIAPQATPPVCRIMDYGKYCFEQQKREKEAKKNQKVVSIKEIRMFSAIDTHDFETKVNQAKKFLEGGDKLKGSVSVQLPIRSSEKNCSIALRKRVQQLVLLKSRQKWKAAVWSCSFHRRHPSKRRNSQWQRLRQKHIPVQRSGLRLLQTER